MEKKGKRASKAAAERPLVKEASSGEKRKSAFTLFWEKYPNGAGEIKDMRAVLR